jgi:hypothetical protein
MEHGRTVGNDFVVQYGKKSLQLQRAARGRVPAGAKVIVRETREGPLRVIHVNRRGTDRECSWIPAAPRGKRPSSAPISKVPKPRQPPAADHPWRTRGAYASHHRERVKSTT